MSIPTESSPEQAVSHLPSGPDSELEISDRKLLVENPVVSVLMLVYRHEDYLAQAIQGVLAQQGDVEFELLIGEDASPDRSLQIAMEFQRTHPRCIRIIQSSSNVGMNANFKRLLRKARGEILMYCEGDDYWCSPSKLAQQASLLRGNPRIGIVHTDWVRSKCVDGTWPIAWNRNVHRRVAARYLSGDLFNVFYFPRILRTCTLATRRSIVLEIVETALGKKEYKFVDTLHAALTTARWHVAYIPEIMAVYRESQSSVLRSGIRARIAYLKSCLLFDSDARQFFRSRADYPTAYRWDMSVGLLLWGLKARSKEDVCLALRDIVRNFGPVEFIRAGLASLRIRRWTLLPNQRGVPKLPLGMKGAQAAPVRTGNGSAGNS